MSNRRNQEETISELTSMKNIGKEVSRKLIEVGITSPDLLRELGSKQAYLKVKERFPNVCLVHLYVLQGAIEDTDYNRLSEQMKHELKEFSDFVGK